MTMSNLLPYYRQDLNDINNENQSNQCICSLKKLLFGLTFVIASITFYFGHYHKGQPLTRNLQSERESHDVAELIDAADDSWACSILIIPSTDESDLYSFKLLEKIGQGVFGIVYKAKRRKDGKVYALKYIAKADPDIRKRSINEFEIQQTAWKISPQHVVKAYAVYETRENVIIIMEFFDGKTIFQRLKEPELDFNVRCNLALQVIVHLTYLLRNLSKMSYGHHMIWNPRIVLSDVTTKQIMVDEDNNIKMIDFDVAAINEETVTSPRYWINQLGPKTADGKNDLLYEKVVKPLDKYVNVTHAHQVAAVAVNVAFNILDPEYSESAEDVRAVNEELADFLGKYSPPIHTCPRIKDGMINVDEPVDKMRAMMTEFDEKYGDANDGGATFKKAVDKLMPTETKEDVEVKGFSCCSMAAGIGAGAVSLAVLPVLFVPLVAGAVYKLMQK